MVFIVAHHASVAMAQGVLPQYSHWVFELSLLRASQNVRAHRNRIVEPHFQAHGLRFQCGIVPVFEEVSPVIILVHVMLGWVLLRRPVTLKFLV